MLGDGLFGELMDTIEARFARPESRRRVRDFVGGLLAPLPVELLDDRGARR